MVRKRFKTNGDDYAQENEARKFFGLDEFDFDEFLDKNGNNS